MGRQLLLRLLLGRQLLCIPPRRLRIPSRLLCIPPGLLRIPSGLLLHQRLLRCHLRQAQLLLWLLLRRLLLHQLLRHILLLLGGHWLRHILLLLLLLLGLLQLLLEVSIGTGWACPLLPQLRLGHGGRITPALQPGTRAQPACCRRRWQLAIGRGCPLAPRRHLGCLPCQQALLLLRLLLLGEAGLHQGAASRGGIAGAGTLLGHAAARGPLHQAASSWVVRAQLLAVAHRFWLVLCIRREKTMAASGDRGRR